MKESHLDDLFSVMALIPVASKVSMVNNINNKNQWIHPAQA